MIPLSAMIVVAAAFSVLALPRARAAAARTRLGAASRHLAAAGGRWLADRFPAPHLLSWAVLRAQAVLELSFVVLAYLTVCRWFGADVYRRAVHARWAVSASYTATFCLIEWSLWNPYTAWDIVVRVLSGVAVPLLVTRLGRVSDGRLWRAFGGGAVGPRRSRGFGVVVIVRDRDGEAGRCGVRRA